MQILILGGSSNIGSALARTFAYQNSLIIVGRDNRRLAATVKGCIEEGAIRVIPVHADLQLAINILFDAIEGTHIDLIIDAASATSGLRDSDIAANIIPSLVEADFLSRTALFEYILLKQGSSPPAVIFISTVLTLLKSPGRVIYTALKAIYETYLLKWKGSFPGNRLLIVYVGTVISRTSESAKPMKLASAVARAFQKKKQTMVFGTSGRFYMALYYAQPLLFGVFSLTQRKIRGLLTNSVRGRPNHTS